MTAATMDTIQTPFHEFHIAAGAKMVDFAGYRLPIQYRGITAEHLAVRKSIGLFDLTHMGEFRVSGHDAESFLQKTTTNNVSKLDVGAIQYTCMTNEEGGIIDDLLLYRLESEFLMVVNGACLKKDFDWLSAHLFGDTILTDLSRETALLAIQGPGSQALMSELTDFNLENMKYYSFVRDKVCGEHILFSRTGYTGEDGFELYIDNSLAEAIWNEITSVGKKHGLELVGLGARDSLRLEMKMMLYGSDMDETVTPIEAGLGWIVDLNTDFIGKEAVAKMKADKPSRKLVCLELEGRAFPRHGYDILVDGKQSGQVTSGTFSPSLEKPIALGYVPRSHAKLGSVVEVEIRGKRFPAKVVKPPFYKNASHR